MITVPEGLGPCEAIDESNLQFRTQNGWRLVAVIQEQTMTPVSDNVPNPQTGVLDYVTKYYPETMTKYLITQDENEAMAHMRGELSTARSQRDEALQKSRELEDNVTRVERECEQQVRQLRQEAEQAAQQRDKAYTELERAQEGNARLAELQEQMKRMWAQLGVERMRQLLGEGAECPIPVPEPKSAHERVAAYDDGSDDIPF